MRIGSNRENETVDSLRVALSLISGASLKNDLGTSYVAFKVSHETS